jgi:SAM-dependent methyltransferase
MAEVDLARLAEGYRHRPASEASLARAVAVGEGLRSGSLILDVGGGPGHHAAIWDEQGHRPIVLDPAPAMTAPAIERGLVVVWGVSQALPYRDGVFDLVWFHLSLHYGDWPKAADEAIRVTRPGGRIEIWTLAADHHAGSLLARWFPSVERIDRGRFPDAAEVERYLGGSVESVERSSVVEAKTRTVGDWLAAAEAGFVSTLQLVDDAELEDGLAAFRHRYPDPSVELTYELRLSRIVARR